MCWLVPVRQSIVVDKLVFWECTVKVLCTKRGHTILSGSKFVKQSGYSFYRYFLGRSLICSNHVICFSMPIEMVYYNYVHHTYVMNRAICIQILYNKYICVWMNKLTACATKLHFKLHFQAAFARSVYKAVSYTHLTLPTTPYV